MPNAWSILQECGHNSQDIDYNRNGEKKKGKK